ncbi:MAG: hypothetical protein R2873_19895 [Caldilineaceae bacterium]
MTQKQSDALKFRCIGPPRGGRVVAVAGHPTDRSTFYFGACAGGVWKTVDGGTYWENISDGFFTSSAVGAMAVSPSDPNVIYVGTGEASIRGDVSWGDGVYKSTDGGKTWRNVGLHDTHHIGKIQIHPQNPDIVYVAALGHAFGPNDEARVFRTLDGGKSWQRVLFVSNRAGAIDIALDATNPRILYVDLAGASPLLGTGQRRRGQRPVAFHRRRRNLDGDHPQQRTAADGHPGQDRRHGVSRQGGARVGHRRGRGRHVRRLPLRRRRRPLGTAHHQPRSDGAALVLHAHLRRSTGQRDRLRHQPENVEIHRRRQELQRNHHPAR